MEKSQVVLIQMHPLLGEGLQRILRSFDDIDLITLPCTEIEEIDGCLSNVRPDVVLLAGEKEDDHSTHLISNLLKHYENIPIVWVELETNQLRFFTSHTLTATSAELLHAIQKNDTSHAEPHPVGKRPRTSMQRR